MADPEFTDRPLDRTIWIVVGAILLTLLIAVPVAVLVARNGGGVVSTDSPPPTPLPAASSTTTTAQPATTTTAPSTTTTTLATKPAEQALFFLANHIENTRRPSPHLMPVARLVRLGDDPTRGEQVRAAMIGLIDGVMDEDRARIPGLSSAVPAGTEVLGVTVDGSIVTIDFNQEFEAGAGTYDVMARLAQVVFTATAVPGIDGVVFAIDGDPVDVFSVEGIVLEGLAQTRSGWMTDFLPLVMIESPLTGNAVTSPVTVRGLANAFEATVSLRVEDAVGNPIWETFATADCGTGCFGSFSRQVFFDVAQRTPGRVVAFEYSALDGSLVNVFAVPVTLLPGGEAPPPSTVDPSPPDRSYDIYVADLAANPLEGTIVAAAAYGTAIDEVGLSVIDNLGPCCFDVSSEFEIVLVDGQNSRLVKFDPDGVPGVLATFDPAEFQPEAVAIVRDVVVMVGRTNRPTMPYEAVTLTLDKGAVLARVATSIEGTVDLRTTTDGVYWAAPDSNPQWVALADDSGVLLDVEDQETFPYLPGETTLTVYYDAGIEVSTQPAGDSARSTFDVIIDEASFADALLYSGYSDGVIVVFGTGFGPDGLGTITAVEMGTDFDGDLASHAYSLDTQRWADVGRFNSIRFAMGGLYVLNTTPDGITILRYELN